MEQEHGARLQMSRAYNPQGGSFELTPRRGILRVMERSYSGQGLLTGALSYADMSGNNVHYQISTIWTKACILLGQSSSVNG